MCVCMNIYVCTDKNVVFTCINTHIYISWGGDLREVRLIMSRICFGMEVMQLDASDRICRLFIWATSDGNLVQVCSG